MRHKTLLTHCNRRQTTAINIAATVKRSCLSFYSCFIISLCSRLLSTLWWSPSSILWNASSVANGRTEFTHCTSELVEYVCSCTASINFSTCERRYAFDLWKWYWFWHCIRVWISIWRWKDSSCWIHQLRNPFSDASYLLIHHINPLVDSEVSIIQLFWVDIKIMFSTIFDQILLEISSTELNQNAYLHQSFS